MEPIVGTLLGAGKLLGDLAKNLKGNEKEKIELLAMQVNWAKDVVATISAERDKLKQENADKAKEIKELQDRIALIDISENHEFETRYNGLLYKREDPTDGPYCPKDKIRMVMILSNAYQCPLCKQEGVE